MPTRRANHPSLEPADVTPDTQRLGLGIQDSEPDEISAWTWANDHHPEVLRAYWSFVYAMLDVMPSDAAVGHTQRALLIWAQQAREQYRRINHPPLTAGRFGQPLTSIFRSLNSEDQDDPHSAG